jgi:ferrous iron transport protein B
VRRRRLNPIVSGVSTPAAPPPPVEAAGAGCHQTPTAPAPAGALRVLLAGAPNVGKSALFNRLTASYVTVSNYPGTSVEVARGAGRAGDMVLEVLDTPGMYSLLPGTEEERVSQRAVLAGAYDVLVNVVDAKNLARMLPLTQQLAETGRPVVLALNMMDEADRIGLRVDVAVLADRLGCEVVPVVAVSGRGVSDLEAAIVRAADGAGRATSPDGGFDSLVEEIRSRLTGSYAVDPTVVISLALQGDPEAVAVVEAQGDLHLLPDADELVTRLGGPPAYRFAFDRRQRAERLLEGIVVESRPARHRQDALDRLLVRPWTGVPILLAVLYLGLYQLVGVFGAGTVVDWLEGAVFEARVNPALESLFQGVPWESLRALFVGEYGVLTLGLRYAVAIVLPLVGLFFLFFSLLEDSGYFPRLALLVDRTFKRIGLSGRAVIPMVLGFACDTMATMVTRTLETRRERVLATLLLALAIPCSAQIGVIMAVLAGEPAALGVWVGVMVGVFLAVGMLGARLLPGERPSFHMELPPLRWPRPANVLVKTYSRIHWYFLEVLPLFLFASVVLWAGSETGVLDRVIRYALGPLVGLLGLPADTAEVFLLGFFRRDYGAAGLFDLQRSGVLDLAQVTVAAVTLTLFVPCVAQFLMMIKERGARTAVGMFLLITPIAFGVGFLLNLVLRGAGW